MKKTKWLIAMILGMAFCLFAQQAQCGIILKAVVVNPSRTKTQKASLKAYLPKEVKPDDIIDFWNSWFIPYDYEQEMKRIFKDHEMGFVN